VQLNHLWSLAVEEHFYLVWPFVIRYASRRLLLVICLACIAFALGLRLAIMISIHNYIACYALTPCRIDGLAMGAMLALLVRGNLGRERLQLAAWWTMFVSVTMLILIAGITRRFNYSDTLIVTVGITLLTMLFGSVVALAVASPATSGIVRFFNLGPLRTFGKFSYGLYVFHAALLPFTLWMAPIGQLTAWTHSRAMATCVIAALGFIISWAAAFLSWHLYEKRFIALKKFFEYRSHN